MPSLTTLLCFSLKSKKQRDEDMEHTARSLALDCIDLAPHRRFLLGPSHEDLSGSASEDVGAKMQSQSVLSHEPESSSGSDS